MFQYVLRFRWVFLFRSDSVKVLVYIMWARLRQLVYEMSFTNVGKVLPVLVSEADKCGRGFAILLWNELHKCGRGLVKKRYIYIYWFESFYQMETVKEGESSPVLFYGLFHSLI